MRVDRKNGLLRTEGLDSIYINGSFFDDYGLGYVKMRYGDHGVGFNATDCEVTTVAHEIRCNSSAGVGTNLTAQLTVGGGVWSSVSKATLTYEAPNIEHVAAPPCSV